MLVVESGAARKSSYGDCYAKWGSDRIGWGN